MSLPSAPHIILNVHKPKKDAIVGSGAPPALNDDEVCIEIPAFAPWPDNPGQVVKVMQKLVVHALTILKDNPTTLHTVANYSDNTIVVDGAPNALTEYAIHIAANISNAEKSHFIDRTFKRALELFNERSADATVEN